MNKNKIWKAVVPIKFQAILSDDGISGILNSKREVSFVS
jgi:hypothetical protein